MGYERCFSVYFVKFVRSREKDSNGSVRGHEVQWLADYTHKSDRATDGGWSKKSDKVTVPLPPYRIYVHDDGTVFAGWDGKSLKAQVVDYEKDHCQEDCAGKGELSD